MACLKEDHEAPEKWCKRVFLMGEGRRRDYEAEPRANGGFIQVSVHLAQFKNIEH